MEDIWKEVQEYAEDRVYMTYTYSTSLKMV